MLERFEHSLSNLSEKVREGWVGREVCAHDERIDKIPHNPGHLGMAASCGGRADEYILLPRIAMKQDLKSGQQGHVEGGPVLARKSLEPLRQFRAQLDSL